MILANQPISISEYRKVLVAGGIENLLFGDILAVENSDCIRGKYTLDPKP